MSLKDEPTMLGKVMATGLAGYQRNVRLMHQAAKKLADPATAEPTQDIVTLLRAETGAKANALTIAVAKRAEDYLFDVLA